MHWSLIKGRVISSQVKKILFLLYGPALLSEQTYSVLKDSTIMPRRPPEIITPMQVHKRAFIRIQTQITAFPALQVRNAMLTSRGLEYIWEMHKLVLSSLGVT